VDSQVQVVNLDDAFGSFSEVWSPRVVTGVNDYDVKIARGSGEFPEHAHPQTDEFFLVLAGTLHLDLPDRTVTLRSGEVFTVPRGVRHRPRAEASNPWLPPLKPVRRSVRRVSRRTRCVS